MKTNNTVTIIKSELDLVDEIFPGGDNDTLKSLKFFNDARKQLFLEELTQLINKNTTAAATLRGKSTSNLYSEIRQILSSKEKDNENDLKLMVQILIEKKTTEGSIVNLQNIIKSIHNIVSSSEANFTSIELEKTTLKKIVLKTLKEIVKIENEQTVEAEGRLLDYIEELKNDCLHSHNLKLNNGKYIKHLALCIIPYYKYLNKIENESKKIYAIKILNKQVNLNEIEQVNLNEIEQVNLNETKQIAIHNIFYPFSSFLKNNKKNNKININLNKALHTKHNIKLLSKDLLCTEALNTRETRLKKVQINIKNYQGLSILKLNEKLKEFIDRLSEGLAQLSEDDKKNTVNVIKLFIELGADIESVDKYGDSALDCAIFEDNIDVIKLLIEAGADIESENKYGFSALNRAIFDDDDDDDIYVIKLLIEAGADIESEDKNGLTPLLYAIEKKDKYMIELFIKNGANINHENILKTTPLLYVIRNRNKPMFKLLLENGANINYENKNGLTPLLDVIEAKDKPMLKLLIHNRANINHENKNGLTPLLHAIKKEDKSIIKLLIKKGVNVNHENILKTTPLLYAIKKVKELAVVKSSNIEIYKDIINLLLENGADINHENKNGLTALSYAKKSGNSKVINIVENTKQKDAIEKEKTDFMSNELTEVQKILNEKSFVEKAVKNELSLYQTDNKLADSIVEGALLQENINNYDVKQEDTSDAQQILADTENSIAEIL